MEKEFNKLYYEFIATAYRWAYYGFIVNLESEESYTLGIKLLASLSFMPKNFFIGVSGKVNNENYKIFNRFIKLALESNVSKAEIEVKIDDDFRVVNELEYLSMNLSGVGSCTTCDALSLILLDRIEEFDEESIGDRFDFNQIQFLTSQFLKTDEVIEILKERSFAKDKTLGIIADEVVPVDKIAFIQDWINYLDDKIRIKSMKIGVFDYLHPDLYLDIFITNPKMRSDQEIVIVKERDHLHQEVDKIKIFNANLVYFSKQDLKFRQIFVEEGGLFIKRNQWFQKYGICVTSHFTYLKIRGVK